VVGAGKEAYMEKQGRKEREEDGEIGKN